MSGIGKKLKTYRLKSGFTQEELAAKLNISFQSYSKIERDITDINLSRLLQIAKILKIQPALFFEANDSNSEKTINELQQTISKKNDEIMSLQQQLITALSKQIKNAT
ncbi:MAG: helix-turn-helix transcriptional regulator [Bacteroidetes bacterium]|nr:helix-turn-helix transcriptional regulator [Bacteroidota bacterium]